MHDALIVDVRQRIAHLPENVVHDFLVERTHSIFIAMLSETSSGNKLQLETEVRGMEFKESYNGVLE